ncbi:reverse transcriptase domain-containing protein [Tanacetum coccineum]
MAGPEPITSSNEGTSNQNKSIIEGHVSALKELLKEPRNRDLIKPMLLDFDEIQDVSDELPANAKIYDGTGDPEDHIGRFVGIGNQGEWPMLVWCRMFQQALDGKARAWFDKLPPGSIDNWGSLQEKFLNIFEMLKACDKDPMEISKIVQKANETLPHFKERWVSESNAIPNVPELMQISSFMSSHKCTELAKHFSDNVPKTIDEMLKRVDDYLRYEEAFRSTEFPRGEFQRKDVPVQWGHNSNDCFHLKQQLELALESGKLNHLVKHVRQRGKGGQRNNGPQKAKVINMVYCNSLDRKRKTTMTDEKWMNVPIIFPPVLARDFSEEALVVEAEVEGYLVQRIHIDEGASIEIMFEHCFNMLHPSIRSSGLCRRSIMKFTIISAPSLYNIILGRPGLKQHRAIPSTIYGMMKFPTPWVIATLVSQMPTVFECRREGMKQAIGPPEEEGTQGTKNTDVFAWEPSDMTKVLKRIIKHSLNANPSVTPASRKRRVFCSEKIRVITKEVVEWLKVGIVRPVKYPTWISNPVLVKKVDGTWRMCIDFKNINSACPKDYYPLPEIDSIIEAVMGFPLKCFLDAYKGYHHVQMAEEDEEKTAFYTDQDMYCYTKEDRESQLYDDFKHFRQHKGETIHDYYVWFAKLINDMRNIKMTMSRMQLNSKFVNNMLSEWGRFVTTVKLNRGAASYGGAQNRVGNANPGQARQVKCYNCNGIGHIARNCTQPKRPQNSKYFKKKMLLMQAQENGVTLDEEQLLFIAGGQDNVIDDDVDEQPV